MKVDNPPKARVGEDRMEPVFADLCEPVKLGHESTFGLQGGQEDVKEEFSR